MNVFGSSSRQSVRSNNDGSHNVYCYSCGEYISTTYLLISRSLCEICRRSQNGEPMDAESIRLYRLSKASRVDIGAVVLTEEPDTSAMGIKNKKFSLANTAGDILSSVGRFAKSVVAPKEERKQKSTELARSKKRGRLFANVDLGDMLELDKELKPKDKP